MKHPSKFLQKHPTGKVNFSLLAYLLVCSIAIILIPNAYAHAWSLYSGHIGNQKIILEIDLTQKNDIKGRYFYLDSLKDIPLSGSMNDDTLILKEAIDHFVPNNPPLPHLIIKKSGDKNWVGHHISSDHKIYRNMMLQPALVTAPPPQKSAYWQRLYLKDPYEYSRLRLINLQKEEQISFMGYLLQWWRDPSSNIRLFTIESGFSKPQLEQLNNVLTTHLWQNIQDYYSCLGGGSLPEEKTWFHQKIVPTLITPSLISIKIESNLYCGGAHSDSSDIPINLNAKTAESLSLEDILWLGNGKPFHYLFEGDNSKNTVSSEIYFAYRDYSFSPWLVKQFQQLYPNNMKPSAENSKCDYNDPNVWSLASWSLNTHGIVFKPYFPRIYRDCENANWLLPYSIVEQHPGGKKITLPNL